MTNTTDSKPSPAVFFRLPIVGYMRPIEAEDASYLYLWVNNPDIRPYLNRSEMMMFEEEIDWAKDLPKRKHTNLVWMICSKGGERVGTMGLHGINWKDGTATTGAMFGNTAKQNQGIGQMSKMMLLNHAFNVLNLRQIYSGVISYNLRSRAYSEKCGYVHFATYPNDIVREGKYYDVWWLLVTRKTWEPLWQKFCEKHNLETFEQMLARHGNLPRK
jgi:RimJ/RimL family protein N-acetyltransferase